MSYSVEIRGLDELQNKLRQAPQFVSEEMRTAMGLATALVEREAKVLAPVNVGQLRSSIAGRVQTAMGGEVIGVVGTNVVYAAPVEFGQRAHFPPLEPLAYWVLRKLGIGGWEGIATTIRIARAIARRGVRARPFMLPAFERSQGQIKAFFDAAVRRVVGRFE